MSDDEVPAGFIELQDNERLRDCVRTALRAFGAAKRRISRETSARYIARALEVMRLDHAHAVPSEETALCDLLCPAIERLVDADERALLRIIEITDWPVLTKKLLAFTARRLGSRIHRYGATADDYVQEALQLFFERKRHYPVERKDLSLFKFLARTVANLLDHANNRSGLEGEAVRLISDNDDPRADELLEELLPSSAPRHDEELIATDGATRFLLSLGDDPPLQAYARLRMYELCGSAVSYAYELNTTVADIRNRERRFRRRADKSCDLRRK